MLILIKSQLGMFMGYVSIISSLTEDVIEIRDPCLVDFLTFPMQSRIGQTTFGTVRHCTAWPSRTITLNDLGPRAYTIFDVTVPDDMSFIDLYKKTMIEAWPTTKLSS